jgi:thiamine biosynthesis lipoprotein
LRYYSGEIGFVQDDEIMTERGRKILSIGIPAVIILAMGIVFQHPSRGRLEFYNSGFREMMGTFVQITVAAPSERQAQEFIDAAFEQMKQINREMNDHDPNSPISQLSLTAHLQPVVISPELFEVIGTSIQYSKLSNGAFDITVGPETQLWRRMQKTGQKPSDEEIAEARSKVGYEKLTLDKTNRTVKFAVEGMKLDVGAIAKGYAVDLAVKILQEKGAIGGMVDIGGNIRCFGKGPGKDGLWLIGLQDPRKEEDILVKLRLNDMAVATSGDYRRFAVVGGQSYSHIINPRSAESVKELASVSVITTTATDADALSTTVSVLGKEKGAALIEGLKNTAAILITSQEPDKLFQTSGTERFVEKE